MENSSIEEQEVATVTSDGDADDTSWRLVEKKKKSKKEASATTATSPVAARAGGGSFMDDEEKDYYVMKQERRQEHFPSENRPTNQTRRGRFRSRARERKQGYKIGEF
jgi:hypothetical protein